jgi:hypothetical protein
MSELDRDAYPQRRPEPNGLPVVVTALVDLSQKRLLKPVENCRHNCPRPQRR